jgi:protein phosphatase 2C family protein 2/3
MYSYNIKLDYSNSAKKERSMMLSDIPQVNRLSYNNKTAKNNVQQSFSRNKIIQYQANAYVEKIISQERNKNFNNINGKKEISKKSDNNITNNNNVIDIKQLIGKNYNKPIDISMLTESIPVKFNQGKISSKSFGTIFSYAANTNQGIVRNYNEDRVSIIINMNQPSNYKKRIPWPKISYFAIFDGHAGNKCAEYLRENLLKLICTNSYFPENITEAIRYGFEKADEKYLNNYAMVGGHLRDNSGTCGLILLIVDDEIYIGNVGDSRCIGSFNNGKFKKDITEDHKPNTPIEKERIVANGGYIYQSRTPIKIFENLILKNKIIIGPYRVFPGRLSVSRTIGDAEGKLPILGGNPKVIIPKPDIFKFNLSENDIDYFILGCDGIFDQLSSSDVFKCASLIFEKNKKIKNADMHSTCGEIVDLILKASMIRQSYDNVTCLIICFKDLLNILNKNENYPTNNIRADIHPSIKKEPLDRIPNNSNNNHNRKSINIHNISKIIQKLKSGNTETSILGKKDEISLRNIDAKNLGSLKTMDFSKINSNKNIFKENNTSIKSMNYNTKEEKKDEYHNGNKNKKINVLYKNNNYKNFSLTNLPKTNYLNYTLNNYEMRAENLEKDKGFYNKKKIIYNGFKKKNESFEKNISCKIESEKDKKNSYYPTDTESNSRNNHYIKNKDFRNYIHTNNSLKNISKDSNINKYINNNKKEEPYQENKVNYVVNNTFLTESKISSNKAFNNMIKKNSDKINLLKNFNDINNQTNNQINQNNQNANNEKNVSFQMFKPFNSTGIKRIYPVGKTVYELNDKKNNPINKFNNHTYYFSYKKKFDKSKEDKVKEAYTNKTNEDIKIKSIKKNLLNLNNIKNNNELKVKYPITKSRSNTDYIDG